MAEVEQTSDLSNCQSLLYRVVARSIIIGQKTTGTPTSNRYDRSALYFSHNLELSRLHRSMALFFLPRLFLGDQHHHGI